MALVQVFRSEDPGTALFVAALDVDTVLTAAAHSSRPVVESTHLQLVRGASEVDGGPVNELRGRGAAPSAEQQSGNCDAWQRVPHDQRLRKQASTSTRHYRFSPELHRTAGIGRGPGGAKRGGSARESNPPCRPFQEAPSVLKTVPVTRARRASVFETSTDSGTCDQRFRARSRKRDVDVTGSWAPEPVRATCLVGPSTNGIAAAGPQGDAGVGPPRSLRSAGLSVGAGLG
jgi:hypothetical protein